MNMHTRIDVCYTCSLMATADLTFEKCRCKMKTIRHVNHISERNNG